jgi:hypothetical protein
MAVKIQHRRGTAAEWTAANPILASGEIGYETDTGLFKVGEGETGWTALGYAGDQRHPLAINTRVECIWTGTAWTTNAGDPVPTSSSLIRTFNSQDDPDADTPPGPYNAYDIWHGVDA